MEKGVRIFSDPERTFPGVLNLIHKPVSTTLAYDQSDLLINIFLQLAGVQMLSLINQLPQFLINPFRRFCQDAVKP